MAEPNEIHFPVDQNDPTVHFVKRLAEQLPELKPVLNEHIEGNGEILPFVLMDEYSRRVLDSFTAGKEQDLLKRFSRILEDALTEGEEKISILIRTSFSESINTYWRDETLHERIVSFLGPHLQSTLVVKPPSLMKKTNKARRRRP